MIKSKVIFILTTLIILLSATCVFAENIVTINGKDSIEPGKTGTITVKISSEKEIGVISGKIKVENVSNITITCKNGWTMPAGDYNHETGAFSILKAVGAKDEEVMEISYTVPNEEGQASITLNEVKVTNINYEDTDLGNITKQISIKNNETQPGETENPDPSAPKEDEKQGENEGNKQNNTNVTKNNQSGKNTEVNTGKKVLPYAGYIRTILPIIIVLLVIATIVSCVMYKRYRKIK